MSAVEIVLIVIGILCICASFFIAKKKVSVSEEAEAVKGADIWTEKDEEVIIKHIDEILEERGMELVETTEDQMNRICNEKIMAIDEFSKPLMEKIHTNHEEVVFMYNMLGEKQKEIQEAIMRDTVEKSVPVIEPVQAEPVKEPEKKPEAEPYAEAILAASETYAAPPSGLDRAKKLYREMPRQESPRESMINDEPPAKPAGGIEVVGDSHGNEIGPRRVVMTASQSMGEEELPLEEAVIPPTSQVIPAPSVKTGSPAPKTVAPAAGKPAVKKSATRAAAAPAASPAARPTMTPAAGPTGIQQLKRPTREFVMQHMEETASNGRGEAVEDQIRALHKQGKSVVEISKQLNIGQGEVKLTIAMINRRR